MALGRRGFLWCFAGQGQGADSKASTDNERRSRSVCASRVEPSQRPKPAGGALRKRLASIGRNICLCTPCVNTAVCRVITHQKNRRRMPALYSKRRPPAPSGLLREEPGARRGLCAGGAGGARLRYLTVVLLSFLLLGNEFVAPHLQDRVDHATHTSGYV